MRRHLLWFLVVLVVPACADPPEKGDRDGDLIQPGDVGDAGDTADTDDGVPDSDAPDTSPDTPPDLPGELPDEIVVTVLLDGAPAADVLVVQGGLRGEEWRTGPDGTVLVQLNHELPGEDVEVTVIASYPQARIRGVVIEPGVSTYSIELTTLDRSDNEDYEFPDPGEPTRRPNTNQCAHCHQTINEAWFESPHRASAKNPVVHDLYAGTGAGFGDEEACVAAGGRWATGLLPGTGRGGERCYFGDGLLHTLNPDCGDEPCDRAATEHGDCANCHAPGINGKLGGRDLLAAQGHAYEYGVHCSVCHAVDSVDLTAQPGVAGVLQILRPSEPGPVSLGAGGFFPLTFGPHHDSPNPRMGSVQRDHFHDGTICAGCHQQDMPVVVPGAAIDRDRWPEGLLPVHSTYEEHRTGVLGEVTRCNSCHMPPDPDVLNGADLQRFPDARVGIQGGWWRPPGSTRQHSWVGPRTPESKMLELAAAVQVDARVVGDEVFADVTVRNASAGHAIPTGEPSRMMALTVTARCGDEILAPVGGDAIQGFAGYVEMRAGDVDLSRWPSAQVGDALRVVRRPGRYRDYDGFGAFADRFTPEQKGMLLEEVAGSATVLEVGEDGTVVLDRALPAGDVTYLTRPHPRMPDLAGAPGVAFARVMAGPDGALMVPHFRAVDVVSDNRLLPQAQWTSAHRFAGVCEAPTVEARLWYRRLPGELVRERGWNVADVLMTEARAQKLPETIARTDPEPTGNTVEIELTAAPFDGDHYIYAYNGVHPGPEIRAQLGDTLRVTLHNELPDPTTIHWHGYKVPFAMDGVTWMTDPVMPGTTFVYEFPLVHAGTFWYHPHFDTARQVDGGLFGMLVVEDPAQPAAADDLVFVLDALDERHIEDGAEEHEEGEEEEEHGHDHGLGAIAQLWRVNGQPAPLEIDLAGGQTARVRILNASNVSYASLTGPQLRHIGSDQGLLPAPADPESILLGPADRAELEWLPGRDGFSLWTQPYSLNGGEALGEPVELVRVRISQPADPAQPLPFQWSGLTPTEDPGHTDIVYAFSGSDRYAGWRINGESFPDITVREVALGSVPIVEVRNVSPTLHPFHMHGVHFEVLSINGVPPRVQTIEDNFNLGVRDVVRLRVLADNPGDWMTHCHILPHAEDGMMTVFRVVE